MVDGVTMVAAGLLVVSGAGKLRSPRASALALRSAGLPGRVPLVRGLAVLEVLIGSAALAVGGRVTGVALAAAYTVITGIAWRQRAVGAGCGCFGPDTSAVTGVHVAVNAVATAAAGAAAVLGAAGLPGLVDGAPLVALTGLAGLVLAVALVRLALVRLPELAATEALHPREAGT